MMDSIGRRLLAEASWGVKLRAFSGAALSMTDMASDAYVCFFYLNTEGQEGYAMGLLAMLFSNIVMQLSLVYIQNRKSRKRRVFREIMIVITGCKPAVDAYRVAAGVETELDGVMDNKVELVFSKSMELAFECIPGSILQCYAYSRLFIRTGAYSKRAAGSIFVSALTAGFVGASIGYDKDVDPKLRKEQPDFYGYIPDGARPRTVMFTAMLLNSALLLLLRSVSIALMLLVNVNYLLWYFAADFAAFYLMKWSMGDLDYWIPVGGRCLGVFTYGIVKFMTDFTGVLQLRSPQELGGAYFSMNLVVGVAASFLATYVFLREGGGKKEGEDGGVLDANIVFGIVGMLAMGWLLSVVAIFATMKSVYKRTFTSFQTAKANTVQRFQNCRSDALRAFIFKKNKEHWRSIRGEVKLWVESNWWIWKEEVSRGGREC